jgi:hypothetical protein
MVLSLMTKLTIAIIQPEIMMSIIALDTVHVYMLISITLDDIARKKLTITTGRVVDHSAG